MTDEIRKSPDARYTVLFPVRVDGKAHGYPDSITPSGFISVTAASKVLKIEPCKIFDLFREWGNAGHPSKYYLPVGPGRNKDGSEYKRFLMVWNWQPNEELMNDNGTIRLVRQWGTHKDGTQRYRNENFQFVSYTLVPST